MYATYKIKMYSDSIITAEIPDLQSWEPTGQKKFVFSNQNNFITTGIY